MFKTTCFDIWRREKETPKLITLCKFLDINLGGGIATGLVTELCGGPGSGKTQLCMQLSINVQYPKEIGGLGGKALYLDTNQDFQPDRLKEISACMAERFSKVYSQKVPETPFKSESLLDNVFYIYCDSCKELTATVDNLRQLLNEQPSFKLLIIDSFSFPLRQIEDISQRSYLLHELLVSLKKLAVDFEIAVVITNELTTRCVDNNWKILPALGDSHSHQINQRIILSRDTNSALHHFALVEKSVVAPKIYVPFQIKNSGIRGVSQDIE